MFALSRSLRTPLMLALVAMLLLRVWVGDAMAMAVPEATASVEHTAMSHEASAPAMPCHEAAPAATDRSQHADHGAPAESANGHDGTHCGTCTLCQVCHSVAMTEAATARRAFALPQAAPQQAAQRFASAEPQPGLKPPIS